MATNVIVAGGFTLIPDGTTRFHPICGSTLADTTESTRVQHLARAAYTLSDLTVQIRINDLTNAATMRSRIAGANGNQSVSVPASTTGTFQDTVNSDSIASGDLINSQTVAPAGGIQIRPTVIAYTLEDTSGDTYVLHVATGASQARGITAFSVVNGGGSTDTSEEDTQYRLRTPTTFTNLRIEVSANGVNDASTMRMRVGGANGNVGASIPAVTTGIFEDTTNSDVVPANTLINCAMETGAGNHNDTDLVWTYYQLKGDSPNRFSLVAGGLNTFGGNSKRFGVIEGVLPETDNVEANQQVTDIDNNYVAENLFIRLDFNTKNGASTFGLRVNLADSALTLSMPSTVSGEFEDTENQVSLVATDDINYFLDTSPSSSGDLFVLMYAVQLSQPALPPSPLPEGLQATQPIMVLRPRRG